MEREAADAEKVHAQYGETRDDNKVVDHSTPV